MDYPKLLYRGLPYPHGETCRVEDETACADKLSQGWRLTSVPVPVSPALADAPIDVPLMVAVDAPAPVIPIESEGPTARKRGRPRKE